ncbi:MAG: DUF4397 domain-containing protein [Ginsengibacter sp.]
MKKYILIATVILSTFLIELSSCKRDYKLLDPVQTTDGMSFLAIIDASPNFSLIFGQPDSFNVFINGKKISGFTATAHDPYMSFGSTFPSTTSGFGYIAVPSGPQQIKLTVSGVNNSDSIPIATFNKTFESGKQYTFMITDNIKSDRDSSQIFVEDDYTFPPTTGYYNLRFIDAVVDDTAAVDLYSYVTNSAIYSNVQPDGLTGFTQFGANLQTTDTFYVTRHDPAADHANTPLSGRTVLAKMAFQAGTQKSYTVYFRGDIDSTSKAKMPGLSFYRHK